MRIRATAPFYGGSKVVTLNDYLFSGDTVLKILHQYSSDLKKAAIGTHNLIDLAHSNFLIQIIELDGTLAQYSNLLIADIIDALCILQNRGNIRSQERLTFIKTDDHRGIVSGGIDLIRIILEHDSHCIRTSETRHGMSNGI